MFGYEVTYIINFSQYSIGFFVYSPHDFKYVSMFAQFNCVVIFTPNIVY